LTERARHGRHALLAALMAAVATAGIASATIPSNGVIDACYSKSGGTLRVIDSTVTKCGKQETSLAWNVQGPVGPQGEPGPVGPEGPAGANGVSAGFGVSAEDDLEIDSSTLAGIVVLSRTMPAGNYVVTARLNVFGGVAAGACWISGDRATFTISDVSPEVHLTVTAGVAHGGGAIDLRCSKASFFSSYFVESASMTGVLVNTLN
jgi:hypothetical protein